MHKKIRRKNPTRAPRSRLGILFYKALKDGDEARNGQALCHEFALDV
jgi:hypothetical protein